MEIGEMIAVSFIADQLDKCPFVEKEKPADISFEPESIKFDDKKEATSEQANNGGTLGTNLEKGSNGKDGTVGGDYDPKTYTFKAVAYDSKRIGSSKVKPMLLVPMGDNGEQKAFPFMVAAHHLIPGEASLYASLLRHYLTKGSSVSTTDNKKWTIKNYIGYNVNGSHNGTWLVGNYAIRPGAQPWTATPKPGVSWGDLNDPDWCLAYVAAAIKVTGAQFHDAHTQYSEAVKKLLNKITAKLHGHQLNCKDCESKLGKEISPPYFVKERLFGLSAYFRGQLAGHPSAWKRPWFTSDKWRDKIFSGGTINAKFLEAYSEASLMEEGA